MLLNPVSLAMVLFRELLLYASMAFMVAHSTQGVKSGDEAIVTASRMSANQTYSKSPIMNVFPRASWLLMDWLAVPTKRT
ncbi:hypothetical protein EYZ11_010090 [Aspergillus tanneri]|uniref:Secreted protein n=1 Tax=Aspergillus tanneri TaxID=1220188 RepID=A0A4S3J8C2_9EURO|nr:hypothetical protein EYZ11_010090 [Aspergillus tanneri]